MIGMYSALWGRALVIGLCLLSSETEKALYSSTVCTIVFSTGEAVPLSVYGK